MLSPSLTLWETSTRMSQRMCARTIRPAFPIAKTGANPAMRRLERTHQCDVQWIRERYLDGEFEMYKIETDAQAADIFTKPSQ
eukprot:2946784-Alexandrium_andersonii.AAC.1